jgi:hypothetical protein
MPISYDSKGNPVFTRGGAPQPQAPGQGGQAQPKWAYRDQAGRASLDPRAELQRLLDEMETGRHEVAQNVRDISLSPNQQDIELVQAMQRASLAPALGQASAAAGARGISGSSIEGVERGHLMAQSALQGQQLLSQMAGQRADLELSKNQQLFNSLVGAVSPQFQLTQGAIPQKKQHGGFWSHLGRGILGAGLGFATGGPMGAVAGGAQGMLGQDVTSQKDLRGPSSPAATPSGYTYIDPNQPWYGGY